MGRPAWSDGYSTWCPPLIKINSWRKYTLLLEIGLVGHHLIRSVESFFIIWKLDWIFGAISSCGVKRHSSWWILHFVNVRYSCGRYWCALVEESFIEVVYVWYVWFSDILCPSARFDATVIVFCRFQSPFVLAYMLEVHMIYMVIIPSLVTLLGFH